MQTAIAIVMAPHPRDRVPPADDQRHLELLLLKVARRADELARSCPRPTPLNRECWLLAEAEVLPYIMTGWADNHA